MGEANKEEKKTKKERRFSKEQDERCDLNIEYRISNNEQ